MKLKSSVDKLLQQMGEVGGTNKGNFGEKAVFKICEEKYQAQGGILLPSSALPERFLFHFQSSFSWKRRILFSMRQAHG